MEAFAWQPPTLRVGVRQPLSGRVLYLHVSPLESVSQLKTHITAQTGISPDRYSLVLAAPGRPPGAAVHAHLGCTRPQPTSTSASAATTSARGFPRVCEQRVVLRDSSASLASYGICRSGIVLDLSPRICSGHTLRQATPGQPWSSTSDHQAQRHCHHHRRQEPEQQSHAVASAEHVSYPDETPSLQAEPVTPPVPVPPTAIGLPQDAMMVVLTQNGRQRYFLCLQHDPQQQQQQGEENMVGGGEVEAPLAPAASELPPLLPPPSNAAPGVAVPTADSPLTVTTLPLAPQRRCLTTVVLRPASLDGVAAAVSHQSTQPRHRARTHTRARGLKHRRRSGVSHEQGAAAAAAPCSKPSPQELARAADQRRADNTALSQRIQSVKAKLAARKLRRRRARTSGSRATTPAPVSPPSATIARALAMDESANQSTTCDECPMPSSPGSPDSSCPATPGPSSAAPFLETAPRHPTGIPATGQKGGGSA